VDATDTVTEATNGGTDLVEASASFTLSAHVENLTLTGGSHIDATGNTLANTLIGNDGNNRLTGGDNDDTLNGGAGGDTLTGGTGKDTLTGGTGNDTFSFTALSDVALTVADTDRITDFARDPNNTDTIRLVNLFSATPTFIGANPFTTAGNQLRVDRTGALNTGDVVTIEGSTDTDTAAEFVIHVTISGEISGGLANNHFLFV